MELSQYSLLMDCQIDTLTQGPWQSLHGRIDVHSFGTCLTACHKRGPQSASLTFPRSPTIASCKVHSPQAGSSQSWQKALKLWVSLTHWPEFAHVALAKLLEMARSLSSLSSLRSPGKWLPGWRLRFPSAHLQLPQPHQQRPAGPRRNHGQWLPQ